MNEANRVAYREIRPETLLAKYNWFKDAAAALDKKQADISVYRARMKEMLESYNGKTRSGWSKEDRQQYNIWSSEHAGVKASYNTLASEYNAQMAKVQWRFCNVGTLPAGATTPLPREFREYTVD